MANKWLHFLYIFNLLQIFLGLYIICINLSFIFDHKCFVGYVNFVHKRNLPCWFLWYYTQWRAAVLIVEKYHAPDIKWKLIDTTVRHVTTVIKIKLMKTVLTSIIKYEKWRNYRTNPTSVFLSKNIPWISK